MSDTAEKFEQRYVDGDLPWDSGRPDRNLADVIESFDIKPCPALEIGCGTGTNAVWLSRQGFQVTALDIAPTAIRRAEEKAEAAGVQVSLHVADFMEDTVPGGLFGFLFDRGVFHGCDAPDDRAAFAEKVASCLAPEGLWLSLVGSTDGELREGGPPRRSAADIVAAVETLFEILLLKAGRFDDDEPDPIPAWVCLMSKR